MARATLSFKLPDEEEAFHHAVKAEAMATFLWDVENEIFRPARKHGYPDGAVSRLLAALDHLAGSGKMAEDHPRDEDGRPLDASDLIGLLEKHYYSLKHAAEL